MDTIETIVDNCGGCPFHYDDRYYGDTCILEGYHINDPNIDIKNWKDVAANCPLKNGAMLIQLSNNAPA